MSEVRRLPASSRAELARLLDERSAADAMAGYYALHHPADRVTLYTFHPTHAGITGFLALARTGLDLFRPLAVPFVASPRGLAALLRAALKPDRPVVLQLPLEQRTWVEDVVELSDLQVGEVLRLDLREFQPVVNMLVVETRSPGGWPRYEIRSGETVYVAAGINWKGPTFAEVYLDVDPSVRGRGYGKPVLAAIAGRLLGESLVALYRVADEDFAGRSEAAALGFRPTGLRILTAQAALRQPEGATAPRGSP